MLKDGSQKDLPLLYNGLVETAMRSLVIIDAFHPRSLTFEELRLLDFFVVFAGDLGAARNLHVPLPGRAGAYAIRQDAIMKGLGLIEALGHLVSTEVSGERRYAATDDAAALTGIISSPYLTAMHAVADWMKEMSDSEGHVPFMTRLRSRIWVLSGETASFPTDQADRFKSLDEVYSSDQERVAGTAEAAAVFALFARSFADWPPGVPDQAYLASVEQAAAKELRSIASNRAGLGEVRALQA